MRTNVSAGVVAFAIALVIAVVLAIGYRTLGTVQAADRMSPTDKATYPQVREMHQLQEKKHMRTGAPVEVGQ